MKNSIRADQMYIGSDIIIALQEQEAQYADQISVLMEQRGNAQNEVVEAKMHGGVLLRKLAAQEAAYAEQGKLLLQRQMTISEQNTQLIDLSWWLKSEDEDYEPDEHETSDEVFEDGDD
jgi:uncharacterized coiled-coil protein SlyX